MKKPEAVTRHDHERLFRYQGHWVREVNEGLSDAVPAATGQQVMWYEWPQLSSRVVVTLRTCLEERFR